MVYSPSFPLHGKNWASFYMTAEKLNIASHYMGRGREQVINELCANNWGWEFRIGTLHVGSSSFRSEFPDYEIVAEYRPYIKDRSSRYAVYARCLMGKYAV